MVYIYSTTEHSYDRHSNSQPGRAMMTIFPQELLLTCKAVRWPSGTGQGMARLSFCRRSPTKWMNMVKKKVWKMLETQVGSYSEKIHDLNAW